MQKNRHNHYFQFTKKERNGILFLLLLITVISVIPKLYPLVFTPKEILADSLHGAWKEIEFREKEKSEKLFQSEWNRETSKQSGYSSYRKSGYTIPAAEMFYFDPNTASYEEWTKLGVNKKAINNILRYTEKGGKFRSGDDIKKIWSLHVEEVRRLLPYIRINSKTNAEDFPKKETYSFKQEKPAFAGMVDINLADSSMWVAMPGIGPRLAERILLFRNKLGGFNAVEQLAEIYGLPDSVYRKLKPRLTLEAAGLRQININNATLEELKQHPYVRYQLANLIVQYRTQHGKYSSVSELKKIMILHDSVFNKIAPYMTTE